MTSAESEDDGVEIRLFSTPVAPTGQWVFYSDKNKSSNESSLTSNL